jgi:hypothetical protein
MFRGILSKATPLFAVTVIASSALFSLPTVRVSTVDSVVDTQKANPNYYYDRETAFIINNAIDFENDGMYVAVNKDGSLIESPIPESVWGYEPGVIPGVYKSHIGQATCIRYLITEYQRTQVNGINEINQLLVEETLDNPTDLLSIASLCADFVIDNMVIAPDDGINESTGPSSTNPDQGDTSSPNSLYYWGIVDREGDGGYFDDTVSNSANGVSRSESVIPWTLAELAIAIKDAGLDESEYLPYQNAAIDYFNWRKNSAKKTPSYSGNSFDPLAGRDFYYGSLGFSLSELTGDPIYRDGDGSSNADGTKLGAIPFLNEHLGTADAPDLAYPPTNSLQEGAYIGAYGRGVPFIKHAQLGRVLEDRDQWWDFGLDPAIIKNGGEYTIRSATDGYYGDKLDTAFAHYRGRELLAGVQRSQWFFYTGGANPNIYYSKENSNPNNLSTDAFGQKTVEYWHEINYKLWDDTDGQEGWLEAVGHGYKPCFSGGNDVPIGDWQAPKIADKVHTLNSDRTAEVTVSGVVDENTPYLSWEFSASGLKTVQVEYTTDNGATWQNLNASYDGTNYVATIPAVDVGTTVYYYAKAQDNFNNWTVFPAGAEEFDTAGNSLNKSTALSQTYTVTELNPVDPQDDGDLPVDDDPIDPEEDPTDTPQSDPLTPRPTTPSGEDNTPITTNPVTTQDGFNTGAGSAVIQQEEGELVPLIRTGGYSE